MDGQVDYLRGIVSLLASTPSLNEVLSYEINDDGYHRWQNLKERQAENNLTPEETAELQQYLEADAMVDEAFSNAYEEIQGQEPCKDDMLEKVEAFLNTNPSPKEIMDYKADFVDDYRFKYLYTLQDANISTLKQDRELDRIQRANHLMLVAKADAWKGIDREAA